MDKKEIFEKIKNRLIVSCQAEGDSPFNSPEGVAMFAVAAMQGGAAAIRSEGFEKTGKIAREVPLPVIGLLKSEFEDGRVRITGSFADVEKLIETGCDMIAIDGTFRNREGMTGPEFIGEVKKRYGCLVMADIASEEEAVKCAEAGADCISTTLSGYTPETEKASGKGPDYELVRKLAKTLPVPVIAEGRIAYPDEAEKMIELGAWSVVVGTAITRPVNITRNFAVAVTKGASDRNMKV